MFLQMDFQILAKVGKLSHAAVQPQMSQGRAVLAWTTIICKLRLYAELADGEDGAIFESFGGAYWEPQPRRTPDYLTWLEQHGLERGTLSTLRWT